MESDKEVNGNKEDGCTNPKKNPNTSKGKPYVRKFPIKKIEASNDVIEKRNKFLVQLFRLIDLPIRLVGDDSNPHIIYNEEVILNTYVNNFELNFTDSPTLKNVVYTVKLNENPRFDKNRILKCISEYKSKAIFKVFLNTTPRLYLNGYHFLNKAEKLGSYPIFSGYNPKLFFNEEKAKETVNELNSDGYQAICE